MAACQEENPVNRSETDWCDYVERLKDISEPNLRALFHDNVPSRSVTSAMSCRMQCSLASLCGRLGLGTKFPQTWSTVHEELDAVMTWYWEKRESRDTYVDREIWATTNRYETQLII